MTHVYCGGDLLGAVNSQFLGTKLAGESRGV